MTTNNASSYRPRANQDTTPLNPAQRDPSRVRNQLYVPSSTANEERMYEDQDERAHAGVSHIARYVNLVSRLRGSVLAQHQRHLEASSKRKKGALGSKTVILHGPSLDIIPDRMRVTMKTAYAASLTTLASPQTFSVTPTDLRDPFQTVSSPPRPLGFDQWTEFYNKFIVIKSRLKVSYSTTTTVPVASAMSLLNLNYGTDVPWTRVATNPRTWTSFCNPGGPVPTMQCPLQSHSEAYGVSYPEFIANEDFYGTFTTSPADNLYYEITFASMGLLGGNITVQVNFELETEVEFFDRIPLPVS